MCRPHLSLLLPKSAQFVPPKHESFAILSVADPGFPVGGVDSRGGYVSKILLVETKESGPLRACAGHTP